MSTESITMAVAFLLAVVTLRGESKLEAEASAVVRGIVVARLQTPYRRTLSYDLQHSTDNDCVQKYRVGERVPGKGRSCR